MEEPAIIEETTSCRPAAKKSRIQLWLIGGAAGLFAAAGGLYAGWDWLAATGVGASLLALAPCLAMCALGVCMARGRRQ